MNLDEEERKIDEFLSVGAHGCRGLTVSPCLMDGDELFVRMEFGVPK